MILIDAGNSSLKAQHWLGAELNASFACAYLEGWPQRLARWLAPLAASYCALASVLDRPRKQLLDQCLADCFGTAITHLQTQAECLGLKNGYEMPATLGVDRWLGLLAAAQISSRDCMVIDAGSAITLDLLRADGQHLGGAILPGMNTSLAEFKRIFAHIDFSAAAISQNQLPGCSTEAAIQIDYELDPLSALAELVDRWSDRFEHEPELILAGGDAARVQKLLDRPGRIVPDLVFRGMRRQLNL